MNHLREITGTCDCPICTIYREEAPDWLCRLFWLGLVAIYAALVSTIVWAL